MLISAVKNSSTHKVTNNFQHKALILSCRRLFSNQLLEVVHENHCHSRYGISRQCVRFNYMEAVVEEKNQNKKLLGRYFKVQ
jgi:hypothetical protein